MEELRKLYGIKDNFDEVTYHKRDNQNLVHSYRFNGGISSNVPSGEKGTIDLDGTGEAVKYTLDVVNGKPLLRISHTFEEIENLLQDRSSV